jgi:phospholipid/cholesterol/gamma-HCH transport system ATP-binding protein
MSEATEQGPDTPGTQHDRTVMSVRGLIAKYGEHTVLQGVDLEVRRGEIRVILGGSGGGKSTLLKNCIGLVHPAGGEVRILGEDLTALEGQARASLLNRVGVLFQNGALLGSLTIRENVALPIREHTDLEPDVIEELVRLKLAQVELSHAEFLLPSELSGGMRKRAALARAMALDPEILFCDEPSAGLDPLTSAELDELLMRMRDRFGMAIVVVTHELHSIETIADTAIMLVKDHRGHRDHAGKGQEGGGRDARRGEGAPPPGDPGVLRARGGG